MRKNNEYKRVSGGGLEHVLIAEEKLGRKLGKSERVHHEDEDKQNNDPANLMVMRSTRDHNLLYSKLAVEVFKTEDGSHVVIKKQLECPNCNRLFEPINHRSTYCSAVCYANDRLNKSVSRELPSPEELKEMIWSKPTSVLCEQFGISDVALGKWCKKLGVEKPPRGHWQKVAFGKA